MENFSSVMTIIGGLGMFLFGIGIMADGLQKVAGDKTHQIMGELTKNMFRRVLFGAILTALIHSSAATTVIVVGLVNAGLLSLYQAAGVIMGANIGTTITAWMVSMLEWAPFLQLETFAPLFLLIGAFLIALTKSERKKNVGNILVGIGLLFVGLSMVNQGVEPFKEAEIFVIAFQAMGKNPLLAILVGTVVTALIQSSTATISILQTMAYAGMVNWGSAVFITMGSNIGTCVTALLSGLNVKANAKRASIIHLLFNVFGTVVVGIIVYIAFLIMPDLALSSINSTKLAIFHTCFNVVTTIILIPFCKQLVNIAQRLVKDDPLEIAQDEQQHLTQKVMEKPIVAYETLINSVKKMCEFTIKNYDETLKAFLNEDLVTALKAIDNREQMQRLQRDVMDYMGRIDTSNYNKKQMMMVNDWVYTIGDLERINARVENIAELAETMHLEDKHFSDTAKDDLKQMIEQTAFSIKEAVDIRLNKNIDKIKIVEESEKKVDNLEIELRNKHILRLVDGNCNAQSSVVFLDVLSNLERISDHAINIVNYVEQETKEEHK